MSKTTLTLQKALGPLWNIYQKPTVHEILVDSMDEIYYEDKGKIKDADFKFNNSKEIMAIIKNLIQLSGKKISADQKSFDLTIGSDTRVQVTLPPISINGPVFNILRIPAQIITLDDLLKWKALDDKSIKI